MREHCLSVRKSLADFVLENAVLRGSFKLSSGKTSNYYIDGKKVLYNPYGLQLVVKAMRQMLYSEDIDAIGGPETGERQHRHGRTHHTAIALRAHIQPGDGPHRAQLIHRNHAFAQLTLQGNGLGGGDGPGMVDSWLHRHRVRMPSSYVVHERPSQLTPSLYCSWGAPCAP